jgi:hypothetical protein
LPPEFDEDDTVEYLMWQYGVYRHLGMSYEEFWQKDQRLVYSYKIKRNLDRETQELMAFLYGRYDFEAQNVIASHQSKSHSMAAYPKEPHPATEREVQEREKEAKINVAYNNYLRQRRERRLAAQAKAQEQTNKEEQ